MNPDPVLRSDLLAAGVPAAVVVIGSLVGLGLWGGSHRLSAWWLRRHPSRPASAGCFSLRLGMGTVALWSCWQTAARWVVLETSWSLWTNAVIGALAVESVIALFQWEKNSIDRATGRTLLALRLLAVALVLIILVQPVLAWNQQRKIERRVVVLVDDSESMQLVDHQSTASEKVEIASFRGVVPGAGRPDFGGLLVAGREVQDRLSRELEAWATAGALAGEAGAARQQDGLEEVAAAAARLAAQTTAAVTAAGALAAAMDDDGRRRLEEVARWWRDELPTAVREAQNQLAAGRLDPVRDQLKRAVELARQGVEAMPGLSSLADTALVATLDDSGRKALDEAALIPRARLAREVLTRQDSSTGTSLLELLRARYDVTVLRFGRDTVEEQDLSSSTTSSSSSDGSTDGGFRMRTDLSGALAHTLDRVPAESLAGVLLLSDGRHNGVVPADDPARSLGLMGAPVHAVAIGSERGPKDTSFLKVEAPSSLYLGDKFKIRAELKADGMRGTQLKVVLRQGDEDVETQVVAVPDDSFRTTLRLSHTPTEKGIFSYSVRVEAVEGEVFTTNNDWPLEVAVTDDRTNVLLVDSVPRWEFRYLRNLFYGRDKSVHLQYVLLNPDEIQGQQAVPAVPASASRKFGEAEATRLPETFEEWMKFDVIMVGDVTPASLPAQTWETIEKAVSERGAMLVVMAGPRSMPHAHQSEVVKRLLPLEFLPGTDAVFDGPEEAFAVRLSVEGRNSPLLALGRSQVETSQIWSEAPVFMWRHPVRAARPGAEVLAYAEPAGQRPPAAAATADDRLAALARQRQFEAEHALLATSRHGLGKVALFTTDQTWRLRYGVGDTHHHRLWGNVLRWGTTENLRAGTESVRLGTDALTYETGQRVRLLARLTADGYKPETGAKVIANVWAPDGSRVASRTLAYREGSSGMYEAELEPLPATGRYRVTLAGDDVDRLLRSTPGAGATPPTVETHFTQTATLNPVELGDLSLDMDLLSRVTTLSGGRVVTPGAATSLAEAFGTGTKTLNERRETTLWDNWPLLLLLLSALTTEWLLRRKAGLA